MAIPVGSLSWPGALPEVPQVLTNSYATLSAGEEGASPDAHPARSIDAAKNRAKQRICLEVEAGAEGGYVVARERADT